MHPSVSERLGAIHSLCEKHRVVCLSVFGSAAREDFDANGSDVDFLVQFDPQLGAVELAGAFFDLKRDLEELFGREVDLITPNSLENPYVRASISTEAHQLYAS